MVVGLVVPRVQGPPSPGALAQRRPRCPWSQMTPPQRPLLQALAGSPYPHLLSGYGHPKGFSLLTGYALVIWMRACAVGMAAVLSWFVIAAPVAVAVPVPVARGCVVVAFRLCALVWCDFCGHTSCAGASNDLGLVCGTCVITTSCSGKHPLPLVCFAGLGVGLERGKIRTPS